MIDSKYHYEGFEPLQKKRKCISMGIPPHLLGIFDSFTLPNADSRSQCINNLCQYAINIVNMLEKLDQYNIYEYKTNKQGNQKVFDAYVERKYVDIIDSYVPKWFVSRAEFIRTIMVIALLNKKND